MDRKQTPDVLGEILGGEVPPPQLAPASPPAQAQRERRPQTRRRTSQPRKTEQWELLLVSFQEYKGWRPRYVNGEELADWMDAPVIQDYATQLGQEGWELASASAGQSLYGLTDVRQLFFKRRKR